MISKPALKVIAMAILAIALSSCVRKNEEADALVEASRKGDLEAVIKELERGVPIDSCASWEGCDTALTSAVQIGNRTLVDFLISRGADVNTPRGVPLAMAAMHGHLDIAKELVAHGAKMDASYAGYDQLKKTLASRGDKELYDAVFGTD